MQGFEGLLLAVDHILVGVAEMTPDRLIHQLSHTPALLLGTLL